jgi:FkbM family methyltransferase
LGGILDRVGGHTFFERFVGSRSVIVDLGANKGAFSREMARKYGCTCFAVECNPEYMELLHKYEGVRPLNVAVADREGQQRLYVVASSKALSSVRTSVDDREIVVRTMRLDELARYYGLSRIDLLKIDIEGTEVALFASLPDSFFQCVGQIAIEFHDFCGLISREDVARIVKRFQSLGFLSINFSKISHGHKDHLFVNRIQCPVGTVEYLAARHITRNVRGFSRIVRRWGSHRAAGAAPAA